MFSDELKDPDMWYVDLIFDTPGVGGVVACSVITTLVVCYGLTVRWISKGHEDKAEK